MTTAAARKIVQTILGKDKAANIIVGRYTNPVRFQMENWSRIAVIVNDENLSQDLERTISNLRLSAWTFRVYFTDTEVFIYVEESVAAAIKALQTTEVAIPAETTEPTLTVLPTNSDLIPHPNKEEFACPDVKSYDNPTAFRQNEPKIVTLIAQWIEYAVQQKELFTAHGEVSKIIQGNGQAFAKVYCWERRYCIVQLGNKTVFALDKDKTFNKFNNFWSLTTELFDTLNDAWNAVYNAQQLDHKQARYRAQNEAKYAAEHAAQEAADAEAEQPEEEHEDAPIVLELPEPAVVEAPRKDTPELSEIRTWEDFTAFMQANPALTLIRKKDNARVVGFEPYNDKAVELELDNDKTSYPFYHVLARYFTVSYDQPN